MIIVYYSKTIDVDRCGIFVFENPPNDNYTGWIAELNNDAF